MRLDNYGLTIIFNFNYIFHRVLIISISLFCHSPQSTPKFSSYKKKEKKKLQIYFFSLFNNFKISSSTEIFFFNMSVFQHFKLYESLILSDFFNYINYFENWIFLHSDDFCIFVFPQCLGSWETCISRNIKTLQK